MLLIILCVALILPNAPGPSLRLTTAAAACIHISLTAASSPANAFISMPLLQPAVVQFRPVLRGHVS